MNKINIILSADNNYAPQCATMIVSILKNTKTNKNICFYILNDGLNDDNIQKICKLKNIKPFDIYFPKIDKDIIKKLPLNRNWISAATYYRLLITDLLPDDVHKCLYLDCDMVCLGDIEELYNFNIDNYYAGTVQDESDKIHHKRLNLSEKHLYFNAGVLLLNIDKLREIDFKNKCFEYFNQNSAIIKMQDQDILNGVFDGHCLNLPIIWNIGTPYFHKFTEQYKNLDIKTKQEIFKNPGIVHYTGRYKPWSEKMFHPFKNCFWKYLFQTPYKNYFWRYCIKQIPLFLYKKEKYSDSNGVIKKYKIFGIVVFKKLQLY